MNDKKKHFYLGIGLLGLMVCLLIAGYFYYRAPSSDNMAKLQAMLNATDGGILPPASSSTPEENKTQTDKATGKPDTDTAKAEFTAVAEMKAEAPKTIEKDYLPPARLAPDMFTFSSLPNNAPVAEFPITLVGQKDLEWYKTRPRIEGGTDAGNRGSVYGRPPGPPPGPPPGGPGGPGGPPEGPPKPPPEVSNSGL